MHFSDENQCPIDFDRMICKYSCFLLHFYVLMYTIMKRPPFYFEWILDEDNNETVKNCYDIELQPFHKIISRKRVDRDLYTFPSYQLILEYDFGSITNARELQYGLGFKLCNPETYTITNYFMEASFVEYPTSDRCCLKYLVDLDLIPELWQAKTVEIITYLTDYGEPLPEHSKLVDDKLYNFRCISLINRLDASMKKCCMLN